MNPLTVVVEIFVLIFAVTIHEVAHGWVAYRLGDPTAHNAGRLTLNPIPHIDPIWSIFVPLALSLMHGPVFGMAKPVPINPNYFRNRRRDQVWVSLAGPLSNLCTACLAFAVYSLLRRALEGVAVAPLLAKPLEFIFVILVNAVVINAILAAFNLIPLPPFDGSWILSGLLPEAASEKYEMLRPYGLIIFILIAVSRVPNLIFTPILDFLSRILR